MWLPRLCWFVFAHQTTWQRNQRTSRHRFLLPGSVLLGLLLALSFGGVQAQAAGSLGNTNHQFDYLALGDSVTFGYSPFVDPHDTSNFVSYTNVVAHALGYHLTNAACPGVTSSHFISLSGTDWECENWLNAGYPLHVSYKTSKLSQLQYAVRFLRSHPRTRLVTLLIGSNDLIRLQALCHNDTACILNGLPEVLATFKANLNTIFATLRGKAHYHHQIVTLTYYSTNYHDQLVTGAISQLDEIIATQAKIWGSAVADGFRAFGVASNYGDPCAAGLLIRLTATTCDIHPSLKGHRLLAITVLAALRHQIRHEPAA